LLLCGHERFKEPSASSKRLSSTEKYRIITTSSISLFVADKETDEDVRTRTADSVTNVVRSGCAEVMKPCGGSTNMKTAL
jgi:hypothetical protein